MTSDRLYIQITKWSEFQHYKDRNPPWIKLHRNLMTSETWVSSSSRDRELAIAIMMLAAATDNHTPADPLYIRRVSYLDYDPDLSNLLSLGFIQLVDNNGKIDDASTMLACARPEREERRDRGETEERQRRDSLSEKSDQPPKSAPKKPNVSRETILTAIEDYRIMARDLGMAVPHGTDRQYKLVGARLSKHGLEAWQAVLIQIKQSEFLQGFKNGKRVWPGATVDWICKLVNFEKIRDGNYDNATGNDMPQKSKYDGLLGRGSVRQKDIEGTGRVLGDGPKLIEGSC